MSFKVYIVFIIILSIILFNNSYHLFKRINLDGNAEEHTITIKYSSEELNNEINNSFKRFINNLIKNHEFNTNSIIGNLNIKLNITEILFSDINFKFDWNEIRMDSNFNISTAGTLAINLYSFEIEEKFNFVSNFTFSQLNLKVGFIPSITKLFYKKIDYESFNFDIKIIGETFKMEFKNNDILEILFKESISKENINLTLFDFSNLFSEFINKRNLICSDIEFVSNEYIITFVKKNEINKNINQNDIKKYL